MPDQKDIFLKLATDIIEDEDVAGVDIHGVLYWDEERLAEHMRMAMERIGEENAYLRKQLAEAGHVLMTIGECQESHREAGTHPTPCQICDGGLAYCKRCFGGESELQESCATRLGRQRDDARQQLAECERARDSLRLERDAIERNRKREHVELLRQRDERRREALLDAAKRCQARADSIPTDDEAKQDAYDGSGDIYDDVFEVERSAFETDALELRRMAEEANDVCPVQVALCADEDLDALWDGIESLVGYDSTVGCAQFIRLASEDIRNQVATIFRDQLGGRGAAEAWFIRDGSRAVPDLRRIANPAQLRSACAHRALAIAIGRSHKMGGDTMYSRLRDYHESECKRAMASLVLTIEPGDGLSLSQQRRIALQRGEETSDG